jgi:hypothetical protein
MPGNPHEIQKSLFSVRAYKACLRGQLSSNVRPQEKCRAGIPGSSHLSAIARSVPIECRKELSPPLEPGRDAYCQSGENDQNMQYWLTFGEHEQHYM